jgi:hypothetical protein
MPAPKETRRKGKEKPVAATVNWTVDQVQRARVKRNQTRKMVVCVFMMAKCQMMMKGATRAAQVKAKTSGTNDSCNNEIQACEGKQ